ncbi:hypothetical protein PG993_010785 [Apiospora rasikravindrae]|uniref:Helicase ATP-binding domain-containing protein n=1 Tax=Apiospora rasikravindrae TaxID=990691 RepID=A0ABR1SCD5_9PEZI
MDNPVLQDTDRVVLEGCSIEGLPDGTDEKISAIIDSLPRRRESRRLCRRLRRRLPKTAEELVEDPAEEPEVEEEDTQDASDKDFFKYTYFTDACNGCCDKLATKVNIAGIQTSLDHYQTMGAFILLTQQAREGIAGGLSAGDMGMGKTLQTLALMVIRGHLVQMRDHVHQNPDCYLPAFKRQKPGDKCPRQGMFDGLQCPCGMDSWARRIAATICRWPTIVFMPRDLTNNSVVEVKNHGDIGSASPAHNFEFKVNHNKWAGQAKDPVNQRFIYEEEELEGVDRNEKGFLLKYVGGKRTYFLASASIQGRRCFPENLPAGLIVMDDAHRYVGSDNPTVPFTFLEDMRKKCDGPVFHFLVSRLLQATGPDD